jgi:hypothetical protein
VLGNLAESRLFLTVGNYGFSWLLRPGVMIILLLTVVGASYPFLRAQWQKRKNPGIGSDKPLKSEPAGQTCKFRFRWKMVFSLALVLIMACALWESRKFAFTSGLFPWLIGGPVLLFAIIQLILDIRGGADAGPEPPSSADEPAMTSREFNLRTAKTIFWILGYLLPIWLLGFKIGAPLCTFVHLKWGENEGWIPALVFTCVTWAFIYLVMELMLHVPFPTGELLEWLMPAPTS